MFKKAFLILITAILIIEGGGCGMNSNDIAKEQEMFNEWLKEFLEEQELPNDYSKLNDGQQYSVKRIYEMIMYLEDKYGIEFEYTWMDTKTYEVENYIGKDRSALKSKYFKFEIIGEGDQVLDQLPKVGTKLEEGKTIVVFMG